eukprot:CAMPEP_0170561650 /NCGR_PEP_ID=MMETSP0211-20121228/56089_1 /TAXON_ID=311385 /ORGANISM="Pseudokeronopsis sp., Strain OXSARD2" /LENGTH=44 /DNA_ID= /DNA_START= /DNA_END= /DNA_ORIENTATION=
MVKASFYQEEIDPNEASQVKLELLTADCQNSFRTILERNESFKK